MIIAGRRRLTLGARMASHALTVFALALGMARVAVAQTLSCTVSGASGKCTATVSLPTPATMVNPALLQLTISPTTSTYTAATTDMDVTTGLATPSVVTLAVEANRSWTVQANGNSAFWSASTGAWTSKPVSDLVWSLTPTGTRTAMSTTAQTVTTGLPGSGSPAVSVYMRPIAHWATDKPGTYSMTVTFTLTTP